MVMRMKTVKDVMSAPPVSVSKTASFHEIVTRLRECRVSAFPVLDEDGKVAGVVSEADLLVKEAVLGEPDVPGDSWRASCTTLPGPRRAESRRPA
jgi:CBS-domain-containing membrane protein